jgi:tryptophan synthase alpha subunit
MQEGGQGKFGWLQLRDTEMLTTVQSALVTYVTAGYPTAQETPDIMLGMEAGGAGMHNSSG